MTRVLRTACRATVAIALAGAGLAIGTGASATIVGPSKIGPRQWFTGLVNGKFDKAIVKVVCPLGSATGEPLPNQTLEVSSPLVIARSFGYTGSRAHSIAGTIVSPSASSSPTFSFHKYNDPVEFPTNITVPCGGTGLVVFVPVPGSHSAKASRVTVSYANVAAGS